MFKSVVKGNRVFTWDKEDGMIKVFDKGNDVGRVVGYTNNEYVAAQTIEKLKENI